MSLFKDLHQLSLEPTSCICVFAPWVVTLALPFLQGGKKGLAHNWSQAA